MASKRVSSTRAMSNVAFVAPAEMVADVGNDRKSEPATAVPLRTKGTVTSSAATSESWSVTVTLPPPSPTDCVKAVKLTFVVPPAVFMYSP